MLMTHKTYSLFLLKGIQDMIRYHITACMTGHYHANTRNVHEVLSFMKIFLAVPISFQLSPLLFDTIVSDKK